MSVSTKPYIGSRDFYPEDMKFRTWMFNVQREVCEKFGYNEYQAPIVEPLSLYQAKSSEEIVGEQIYRFTDRGDREVAIRPEMTPTLARMVAAKWKELQGPLRWYSIANFMRYERPGRGRLREFYQLNADLIGTSSAAADAEIMLMAIDLLFAYGAGAKHFRMRFSDRRLMDSYLGDHPPQLLREIGRLLDKKEKIGDDKFEESLKTLCPDDKCAKRVREFLEIDLGGLRAVAEKGEIESEIVESLEKTATHLKNAGVEDCLIFDPGIVRGFDYYTGIIFEVNDLHEDNRRALFGGGRYDRLLGLFGNEQIPAVGFGMGDVTLENFLNIHGLVPEVLGHPAGAYLTLFSAELEQETFALARNLRAKGIEVETALEAGGKFKKQIQTAERKGRRYLLILGEDEVKNGIVRVKDLSTGNQEDVGRNSLSDYLKSRGGIV